MLYNMGRVRKIPPFVDTFTVIIKIEVPIFIKFIIIIIECTLVTRLHFF